VILKRITKKQIAVIHDLIPLKYPSNFPVGIKGAIYILLNKLALKNYDLIITDSEASKVDIIKILEIEENKIKVIYPCLPNSFLKLGIKNLDLNKNSKFKIKNYCLYVGDATWNKNLVNLAKAIKLANVNCVFVGKVFENCLPAGKAGKLKIENLNHPWQSELKEFLKLTKGDSHFIFKGFVPDSELIKLYEQANVDILPSRDEGFGFSYLEASVNNCPSILSDIPVLKEISDNNALFFNPKNPDDIAKKISKIYSDKNLRQKLIINSKKRSLFFSSKAFRKNFLSII
jgi:glycosyltransferase involved in cell wall biosynthesis